MNAPRPPSVPADAEPWSRRLLWVLVTLMAAATATKLCTELPRILWLDGDGAATDLRKWHLLSNGWMEVPGFGGSNKYAVYPPATYVLLWPLVGVLPFAGVRWLWALTMALSAIGVSWMFVRESGARTRLDKAFVALLLPSMNAAGAAFGIGQVGLQVLCGALASLLLLRRMPPRWQRDLAAAGWMLLALIKPTLSAPFFWVLWLRARRWRPAVLTGAAYLVFTATAILWQVALTRDQDHGAVQTSVAMMQNSLVKGDRASVIGTWSGGYGDLHWLLFKIEGFRQDLGLWEDWDFHFRLWNTEASLLALALIGLWVWRHRDVEFWTLIGVTALFARMFVYHRMYDDLLVVPATFALYRLARTPELTAAARAWARRLTLAMVLVMMMPSALRMVGDAYAWLFEGSHVLLWLVVLWFLWREAGRQRRRLLATAS